MDERTFLGGLDKATLKKLALSNGLPKVGFNGRSRSRMRKKDFIEFLIAIEGDDSDSSVSDEELIELFNELVLGQINLQILSHRRQTEDGGEEPQERTPNEEDENVPDLTLKDFISREKKCDADCVCDICLKNEKIKKENSTVKTNLCNIENKITCVICHTYMRNVIFNPCNHLATCITCSKNPSLDKCPLCRKVFESTTRVFS